MRKILNFPEYSLEIHIEGKRILCFDHISKKIIYERILRKPVIEVKKETQHKFLLTQSNKKKYTLFITPEPKLQSVISTESSYILDLQLTSPNHGFFFGLYQIGEFILTQVEKLKLIRTFFIEYCNKGCITPSNTIFLSLRKSKTLDGPHSYYLAKVDWTSFPKPSLVWKRPVNSPILSMVLVENTLIFGMKNGTLHQWDIQKEKLIQTVDLFHSPISAIEKGNKIIIVTSWTGDIAALLETGTILWKTKLGNEGINGVYSEDEVIHCIDYRGNYFQLDSIYGIIKMQKDWNIHDFPDKSTLSNMIETNNWFIISSGGHFVGYWKYNDSKTFRCYRINQPLVQQFASHPKGFYTGDDEGRIIYWKLLPITVKKGIIQDDPWHLQVKEAFTF